VTKSGELVGEIAAASQEQAQGIGQVNTSVAEMDKVVQSNAANAEESAAAAEQMNAQAEQMKEYVGDLVKLIGSSDSKVDETSERSRRQTLRLPPARGHLAAEARPQTATRPTVGGSPKRQKKGNGNLREVSPEQVIPLSEEDLRDF
jgi:methyl-accepting chemotaxis protein